MITLTGSDLNYGTSLVHYLEHLEMNCFLGHVKTWSQFQENFGSSDDSRNPFLTIFDVTIYHE